MATTGYSDTFNRTVSNGLGVASSGQTYTLLGTATQFSVAPSQASIAIASVGDKLGYVDTQAQIIDVTAQVALTAIPATNLATVGFVGKLATISNYYNATMMVAAGGAISLRFSKVISGGLSTIATVATGLTYIANTFYNLRYQNYWSQSLQTNVMSLKLWAIGATEPGGWMATTTDGAITPYTSGTQFGIMGRDESAVVGTITTRHRALVARSYSLPMPATTDPMCYDPAIAFPKQTALESLADAADVATASLDPLVALAGLFPRVRISNTNLPVSGTSFNLTFGATEFNIGTPTNLGYDNAFLYLGPGVWLATFEMQLTEATSDYFLANFNSTESTVSGSVFADMRSNPSQNNDQGVGGCLHMSKLIICSDPTTPVKCGVTLAPNNTAAAYTATYLALSAIKISEYFL